MLNICSCAFLPSAYQLLWSISSCFFFIFLLDCFLFLFFIFLSFEGRTVAHGGSQARGWMGATATSLHHSHSNVGSKPCLWPTPRLTATLILNPLSKARDGTLVLMDTSQIRFCWATVGTPPSLIYRGMSRLREGSTKRPDAQSGPSSTVSVVTHQGS